MSNAKDTVDSIYTEPQAGGLISWKWFVYPIIVLIVWALIQVWLK